MLIRSIHRPYKVRPDYYVIDCYTEDGKRKQRYIAALGEHSKLDKARDAANYQLLKAQAKLERIEYAISEMQGA